MMNGVSDRLDTRAVKDVWSATQKNKIEQKVESSILPAHPDVKEPAVISFANETFQAGDRKPTNISLGVEATGTRCSSVAKESVHDSAASVHTLKHTMSQSPRSSGTEDVEPMPHQILGVTGDSLHDQVKGLQADSPLHIRLSTNLTRMTDPKISIEEKALSAFSHERVHSQIVVSGKQDSGISLQRASKHLTSKEGGVKIAPGFASSGEDSKTVLQTGLNKVNEAFPERLPFSVVAPRAGSVFSSMSTSKDFAEGFVKVKPHPASSAYYLRENDRNELLCYLRRQTTELTDILDDDAVATTLVRTNKIAKERFLLSNFDPEADSEEEEEHAIDNSSYFKEIEFQVRQDFFNTFMQDTYPSTSLDKKTIHWLKKEMGLNRRNEFWDRLPTRRSRTGSASADASADGSYLDETGSDSGESDAKRRRLTRGMARTKRVRKREERGALLKYKMGGLSALLEASKDFEANSGSACLTFNTTSHQHAYLSMKMPKTPKTSNTQIGIEVEERDNYFPVADLSGFVRTSKWKSEQERANMGLDRKLEIRVSSILIDGANIEPVLSECFKSDRESQQVRTHWKGRSKKPNFVKKAGQVARLSKSKAASHKRNDDRQADLGILTPQKVHHDFQYATWCSKLINCLNSHGGSFARYEFFYSEIDRPWYSVDCFRKGLEKYGISPDTKFTRDEWNTLRRMIRKRPRRFSGKFIQEEKAKLISYRTRVMKVQQGEIAPKDFPHEIPRRISVGDIVTALHPEEKILHRGVVLDYMYDEISCMKYIVQFDRQELGVFTVSGFDVASHGVRSSAVPENAAPDLMGIETAKPSQVYRRPTTGTTTGNMDVSNGTKVEGQTSNHHYRSRLSDSMELLIQRKVHLVTEIAMLKASFRFDDNGLVEEPNNSNTNERYAWLVANLDFTTESLREIQAILQQMKCKEAHQSFGVSSTTDQHLDAQGEVYSPWIVALQKNMDYVQDLFQYNSLGSSQTLSYAEQMRHACINAKLEGGQNLLLCSEYISNLERPIGREPTMMSNATDAALKQSLVGLDSSEEVANRLVVGVERQEAMQNLKDAVANFQSKLAALHSRHGPRPEY